MQRLQDDLLSRVRAIWAEVLDLQSVGADDDFFLLGGDSLAAAIATSLLSARLGVDLAVDELYRSPTPAMLVARLSRPVPSSGGV